MINLERILKEINYDERLITNMHFYIYAAETILKSFGNAPLQVLDVGCSFGYGVKVMSTLCPSIKFIGADINRNAIHIAKKNIKNKKVKLEVVDITDRGDVKKLISRYGRNDVITCFEVFEHIPKNKSIIFLKNLNYLLKEDGILFISTPNKYVYDLYAYTEDHINELTFEEFTKVLSKYFKIKEIYGSREYNPILINTLWKYDLVARKGDKRIQLNFYQKMLLKLFITILQPDSLFLSLLRRIDYKRYLKYLFLKAKLNSRIKNSSFVFVVAEPLIYSYYF